MSEKQQESYTNDDKLRWEIEKLKAETGNLRRPFLRNPSSWITILTVILAVSGVTIQYFNSNREYQLAEIKKQQATLDAEKAHSLEEQLQKRISVAQTSLTTLESQRDELAGQLKVLKTKAQELGNKASTVEAQQLIREVNQTIDTLNTINNRTINQSEETAGTLQAINTDINDSNAQAKAFAIIASFKTLAEALAYARQLSAKNPSFPVEVYQRSQIRYQVTLGGYLTPEEANKRVAYAKQQNIAPDAYVRFAQDWGSNLFQ